MRILAIAALLLTGCSDRSEFEQHLAERYTYVTATADFFLFPSYEQALPFWAADTDTTAPVLQTLATVDLIRAAAREQRQTLKQKGSCSGKVHLAKIALWTFRLPIY